MRLKETFFFFAASAVAAVALLIMSAGARQAGSSPFDGANLPFRLENVVSAPIPKSIFFFVADVDTDGNDDLLVSDSDRLLWYRLHENEMTLAGEGGYERPGSTRMVADADGDGRPEFFVLMETPEGAVMSCHSWFSGDGPSVPAYTIGPLFAPRKQGEQPPGKFNILGSFTEQKGGRRVFFIGLNSSKLEAPCRTLLALDGATDRILWRFEFAPYSQQLACDDFGDGVPRVLLTTSAVDNEISCHGTTSGVSCLFCLDMRDGRALWKKEMTGYRGRSYVALADINADGRNEILAARFLAKNDPLLLSDPPLWNVAALNHEGEILSAATLPIRPASIGCANLDSSPASEILVEGVDGRFAILEHNLAVRRIVNAHKDTDPSRLEVFGVRDLGDDGTPEIICGLDNLLVVRDHSGTPIAERSFKKLVGARIARYDGESHIVAMSGDSVHVMTLRELPFASRLRAHSRRLAIGAAAAVLVSFWGAFHIRRILKRRRERHITEYEVQNELLTAMSAFGHGGSSLKVLDRLRLHLKNWERIRSEGVTREQLFSRLSETFRETIVPELEHLVMLSRRARVPEEIWNALLAEAARAGGEMEGILASGAEGSGRQNMHVGKALAALDTLDESVAGIRSHLRSVFRAPVPEALERLIERFQDEYGGKGVTFDLAQQDPAAAACVFISPVSFDKIFEVLLSNAVRATAGKAPAEISIAVQWEGNYCRIDVRDNGCGIPRDDWERVFERHFTTKAEGGGFGLHYAREELAKFGGKIYVLDSAAGSGTTLRVILRKSEKAGAV